MCRPYCSTPSFFFLSHLHFLFNFSFLSPSPFLQHHFLPERIRKLIFSLPPHYKTPPDDSSFPLTSLSALPLHSFSSLWHLFLSLTTPVPSLANFHRKEMRGLRTFKGRQAEPLCTTCFTCEASGGLQSIIMISSPVGAEGERHESSDMVWFELVT